jgi:hypothetical protein
MLDDGCAITAEPLDLDITYGELNILVVKPSDDT